MLENSALNYFETRLLILAADAIVRPKTASPESLQPWVAPASGTEIRCRWGAPLGRGLGIQNTANLQILRERIIEVPLIVDAGVGTASDAAIAMELGADAVLMNTDIAAARKLVLMAEAMMHAVLAGRQALPGWADDAEALRYGEFAAGGNFEVT